MREAFLIGSPRSGTTILENILNCHDDIAEFYEPYYLWENFFCAAASDVWDPAAAHPDAIEQIRREFRIFARKCRRPLVLDKSPAHAFNMPIVQKIFPRAKWIHIVRDGRDVTLSIGKEWEKRKKMVETKDFLSLFRSAGKMLDRQPVLRFKWMALTHELKNTFSLNPYHYLNKSRWKGEVGWGPRFENWEAYLNTHSVLAFNAMQWAESVKAVQTHWNRIDESCRLTVRYEQLLLAPHQTLTQILRFLGCAPTDRFFSTMPALIPGNFNKWKTGFSTEQMAEILPILNPQLAAYGYVPEQMGAQ